MKRLSHLDFYYRAWRYRLKVEPAEIAWVRSALKPGDLAVDAGAHKGAFTYWMARAVGPEGKVLAFEPQPELAERLVDTVRDLELPQVSVENAGLSSSAGRLTLSIPGPGPSPGASFAPEKQASGRHIEVPVTTLDERVQGHSGFRLLKCDVEGHELEVFKGGARVLAEQSPAILFECEARHHQDGRMEEAFRFLESLGYRGQFFFGDALLPRASFQVDRHQVPDRRPYGNNFLFTKESSA
ncbi:MAG: FkbM family methyltransferase [Myxococcota bacterium]